MGHTSGNRKETATSENKRVCTAQNMIFCLFLYTPVVLLSFIPLLSLTVSGGQSPATAMPVLKASSWHKHICQNTKFANVHRCWRSKGMRTSRGTWKGRALSYLKCLASCGGQHCAVRNIPTKCGYCWLWAAFFVCHWKMGITCAGARCSTRSFTVTIKQYSLPLISLFCI